MTIATIEADVLAADEADVLADAVRSQDDDCKDDYYDYEDDEFDLVARAVELVGRVWRDVDGVEVNMQPVEWFDALSDEQRDLLVDWAADVSVTGGTLVIPELLAVELKPAAVMAVPDAVPVPVSSPDSGPSPSPSPSPAETCDEARIRIEGMIPVALSMFDEAQEIAASRKAAHDAAKKNVDVQQDQINELFRELADALRGVTGGEYQTRLPFDRVEGAATDIGTQSDDLPGQLKLPLDAATAGVSSSIDPALGWAVHVLTREQLATKTNGQSNDAGITDAIADSLVNNSINTIGELESHQRRVGQHWHRPLKAIGEGKADLIRDALAALRRVFPMVVS